MSFRRRPVTSVGRVVAKPGKARRARNESIAHPPICEPASNPDPSDFAISQLNLLQKSSHGGVPIGADRSPTSEAFLREVNSLIQSICGVRLRC